MFICLGCDLRGCQHCAPRLKERCVEGGFVGKNWALNCTGLTYLNFHKLHQIELIVSKNLSNEGNWLWISLLNLNLAQHIQVAFQKIAKLICRIKTFFQKCNIPLQVFESLNHLNKISLIYRSDFFSLTFSKESKLKLGCVNIYFFACCFLATKNNKQKHRNSQVLNHQGKTVTTFQKA